MNFNELGKSNKVDSINKEVEIPQEVLELEINSELFEDILRKKMKKFSFENPLLEEYLLSNLLSNISSILINMKKKSIEDGDDIFSEKSFRDAFINLNKRDYWEVMKWLDKILIDMENNTSFLDIVFWKTDVITKDEINSSLKEIYSKRSLYLISHEIAFSFYNKAFWKYLWNLFKMK